MSDPQSLLPPSAWRLWVQPLQQRWASLAAREQVLFAWAALAIAILVVWLIALQPALRTLREAPAALDGIETQLQAMQRLATEAQELRQAPQLNMEQASEALRAATERLGPGARLTLQGERAVLTLNGVASTAVRQWLGEVRAGARARPLEAQLNRGPSGFTGTLVVSLAVAP